MHVILRVKQIKIMWAKAEEDSVIRGKAKSVFLPSVYVSEDDIMTGTILQIGGRDFSLPGGPGRLREGRSLAVEITWLYCWMWSTTFPLQTGGNQRGLSFPMVLPSHIRRKRNH